MSLDGVVRDTRADAEYFRAVTSNLAEVCVDEDERVARPTGRWRAPHERGVAAGNALKPHWDLFSALYSSGASFEELRVAFGDVLAAAERAHELGVETLPQKVRDVRFGFGKNKDFCREWLWLVSLALAFEVDDATFARAVDAVEFGWGDQLLDRLIATRRPEHPIGEKLAFPRIVGALADALQAPSPADAEKLVGRYLRTWYTAWKGVHGWGGHEFVGKRLYWGYWAFETLGVVKALGLDDASFRDNEYYPSDFAGLRKASMTEGLDDLRKAGLHVRYRGMEYRLVTRGEGWALWTDRPTPGFTKLDRAGFVRRIEPDADLECFRIEHRGTYRGIPVEVAPINLGRVMLISRDSESREQGFEVLDRYEWAKAVAPDDEDLRATTTRTPVPAPWRR